MMERFPSAMVLVSAVLLGNVAIGQETSQLRVSAVVPPSPCEFPDPCQSETLSAPPAQTSVSIDSGVVSYVGPTPTVTQTDDQITVLF